MNPYPTQRPQPSEGLCETLTAAMITSCFPTGLFASSGESPATRALIAKAERIVGQKTSMSETEVPLPVSYGIEFSQLIAQYGTARRYGTVVPMGFGKAKMPRVSFAPQFGPIVMGAPIIEKSPAMVYVTFEAIKWGGSVRLPAEMLEDQLPMVGTWLADFAARQTAKIEDLVYWRADGTANYASVYGLPEQLITLGKVLQLGNTRTKPADITLDDMVALRDKVSTAALTNAAYYCNRSHGKMLRQFNAKEPLIYIAKGPNGEPVFDGYPVRWIDVMPTYSNASAPGQAQIVFGDLSYHWLATRGDYRFTSSKHVHFDTDEVLLTALERFCTGLMSEEALAVLQLADS